MNQRKNHKKENRTYLGFNDRENTIDHNSWDPDKEVLKGKFQSFKCLFQKRRLKSQSAQGSIPDLRKIKQGQGKQKERQNTLKSRKQ